MLQNMKHKTYLRIHEYFIEHYQFSSSHSNRYNSRDLILRIRGHRKFTDSWIVNPHVSTILLSEGNSIARRNV